MNMTTRVVPTVIIITSLASTVQYFQSTIECVHDACYGRFHNMTAEIHFDLVM